MPRRERREKARVAKLARQQEERGNGPIPQNWLSLAREIGVNERASLNDFLTAVDEKNKETDVTPALREKLTNCLATFYLDC